MSRSANFILRLAKTYFRLLYSGLNFENRLVLWAARLTLFTAVLASVSIALLAIESLGSLRSTSFYTHRLKQASTYEFVSGPIVESIGDELESVLRSGNRPGLDYDSLAPAGLSNQDVVESASNVASPAWLQETTEGRLHAPADWLAGRREGFSITIPVAERVPAILIEANRLIEKADTEGLVVDHLLAPVLDDVERQFTELGIDLDPERVADALKTVFPQQWIEGEAATTLKEVAPYFAGQSDSFEVRINLDDRTDAAAEALAEALLESESYDEVLKGLVRKLVSERLSENEALSQRVIPVPELLDKVDMDRLVQAVDPQSERAISQVLRYITGQSDDLLVEVDLRGSKDTVRLQALEMAGNAFQSLVREAPDCAPSVTMVHFSGVPACIPVIEPGRSMVLDEIERSAAEVDAVVEDIVNTSLPDEMSFTESDIRTHLRDEFGESADAIIDEVRSLAQRGLVYTQDDLRTDMAAWFGPESIQRLDTFRGTIRDGVELTEQDLLDALHPDDAALLSRTRAALKLAPWLAAPMSAAAVCFAASIGMLARGSHRRQFIWATGSAALACGVVVVLAGPVYTLQEPALQVSLLGQVLPAGADYGDFPNTVKLVATKAVEIAMDVSGGFTYGVAAKAAIAMGVALALAGAGTIRWSGLKAAGR